MAKKTKSVEQDRLNVRLPPTLGKRLNLYLLKFSNKEGKLSFGIKSAIAYKALEDWLDSNENDVDAWKKLEKMQEPATSQTEVAGTPAAQTQTIIEPDLNAKFEMNWSVIEGKPREVKVKGKIRWIIDDLDKAYSPPLSDYYTVALYPEKSRVYHLKFKTKEELERHAFTVDETVIIEGTLRLVDGKQIVTNVKRSSEEF